MREERAAHLLEKCSRGEWASDDQCNSGDGQGARQKTALQEMGVWEAVWSTDREPIGLDSAYCKVEAAQEIAK